MFFSVWLFIPFTPLREAGIVSAPMVIIVSITGISSFALPRFNMALSLRFPFMLLDGTLGMFGIRAGLSALLLHLCSLGAGDADAIRLHVCVAAPLLLTAAAAVKRARQR